MRKILLVEDDPFIRDITSIKLSENDFAVVTAHSGEEVLVTAKKEGPDLILLDLDLPGMTGLDALKALRKDAELQAMHVIIFSNNDDPEVKKEAEEIGVSGFFVKAATGFDDLHAHITAVLEK